MSGISAYAVPKESGTGGTPKDRGVPRRLRRGDYYEKLIVRFSSFPFLLPEFIVSSGLH